MARFLGIDFAPLRLPTERRLQTLVVMAWVLSFIVLPTFSVVVMALALLLPPFNLLAWPYLAFMLYDRNRSSQGGRRVDFVRRLSLWRYFRDFFPIRLLKTAHLDPAYNYIFGFHPHGILSCGAFCNFATEATNFSQEFQGIKPHLLTLKANLRWPLLRGYNMACGVCDVSRESLQHIFTRQGVGNAAIIVIGGAEEALLAQPQSYQLKLRTRKGFIRVALQYGAHLVPVYSFGENDLFVQTDNPQGSRLRRFQSTFKRIFGFSPPLFHGRGVFQYTFGFLPYRKPVNTVVGRPIAVMRNENASEDDVNELHERYMDALQQLFDDHKEKYGVPAGTRLEFV